MKRTKLLLGVLAVTAIATSAYLTNNGEEMVDRGYFAEDISEVKAKEKVSTWTQSREYYDLLHSNPATGEYDGEGMDAILQNFLSMNFAKTSDLAFVEEGPDNVGGRTRAIEVHPDSNLSIYAGAVDGGIFVTRN